MNTALRQRRCGGGAQKDHKSSTNATPLTTRFGRCSFYTKWLYYLSPFGILTFVLNSIMDSAHASKVLAAYSVILVTWGTLMVAFWRQRSEELKTRWGLDDLDGHEKRLRSFEPEKDKNGVFTKDRDFYPMWKRYAVIPSMVPFFIFLFCILYSLVLLLFWFEMWVVFDWGECTKQNEISVSQGDPPECRSSTGKWVRSNNKASEGGLSTTSPTINILTRTLAAPPSGYPGYARRDHTWTPGGYIF